MTAMRTRIECCHGCSKRAVDCHSTCQDYIKQSTELNEYRAIKKSKKNADVMIAQHILTNKTKRHIKPKFRDGGK